MVEANRRSTGGDHEIADHLARDAGIGEGKPGDDLAIAGIQDEEDANDLAVSGMDFQMIRTPPDVRAQRNDDAVMDAAGTPCG